MYYPCSDNKGADQLRVFVFAYVDCWSSHETAQMTDDTILIIRLGVCSDDGWASRTAECSHFMTTHL